MTREREPRVRWLFKSKELCGARFRSVLNFIQPEERKRIAGLNSALMQTHSLAGRLMIRHLVADVYGVPYKFVRIRRTTRGRPYVTHVETQRCSRTQLEFSVSHDGDWVALCSGHRQIGCDIVCQRATQVAAANMLAGMWDGGHLTPTEWDNIRSHIRLRDQLHYFYRVWACKEAYIKALGVGLDFDLGRIEVRLTNDRPRVLVDGHPLQQWTFDLHVVDADHLMAVAEGPPAGGWRAHAPPLVQLGYEELTSGACPFRFRELDAGVRSVLEEGKMRSVRSQVHDSHGCWRVFLDVIQGNWFP